MAIKTTRNLPKTKVSEWKNNHRKYPYIGECDNTIVLFTAPSIGVVIHTTKGICNDSNYVGEFKDTWAEYNFIILPIGTTITLTT